MASQAFTRDAPAAQDTLQPLEQAHVLPLRYYTDAAFHEVEIEHALRHGWHPVGRASQLLTPGDFFTVEVINEPVLVTRGEDGEIRAFLNVCRHRGTKVADGAGCQERFRCPYHSWTYDTQGKLVAAPFMNKTPGFDPAENGLRQFAVEIWNGFVMVNLDREAPPLAPQIEPLTRYLEPFDLADRVPLPLLEVRCDWNWKFSMENFTEAYHHIAVHANSINPEAPAEKVVYDDSNDAYSLFHIHSRDGQPRDRVRLFPAMPDIPESYLAAVGVLNVYPTLHILVDPGVCLWLQFDIHGVEDHTLRWVVLVPPATAALPDIDDRMAQYRAFMTTILEEDIAIIKRVRESARTRTWQPGRYCSMEKSLHQMHRWLMKQLPAA